MRLPDGPLDEGLLHRLGGEALTFLVRGDYQGLADRFGYALAFGKDPAEAIRADAEACLLEDHQGATLGRPLRPEITIRHFGENTLGLFALVECRLGLEEGPGPLLAELVVSGKGDERHLTLEQIS